MECVEESPEKVGEALLSLFGTKEKEGTTAKMIGLAKISDKSEPAAWYSASDCFVNLTHEDTFPTVNIETVACKTNVITYDVGGCRETLCIGER